MMNPICIWRYRSLARLAALDQPVPAESPLACHVADCARCRAAWRDLQALHRGLVRALTAPAPASGFSEAVQARIDAHAGRTIAPSPLPIPAYRRHPAITATAIGLASVALAALAVRSSARWQAVQLGSIRLGRGAAGGPARDGALSPTAGLPAVPPVQQREPGSWVKDDLLLLNPVRIAGADTEALGTAASALAAGPSATDPRLQQKVTVHATGRRLSDLLQLLSKATGVALVARMEVADEPVSIWAEDRALMDVMRDLRHLRGYYWSRARRGEQYVYSLWQDAQSGAREEAELQRFAIERQRQFEEGVRRHLQALNASEEDLKRLAQEDPYLVAQMKHPVVRAGYQLFAALSPDQQAELMQGQTPSRMFTFGDPLFMLRADHRPGDRFFDPVDTVARYAPRGDVVTLRPSEMTPPQRAALAAFIRGAAAPQVRYADTWSEGPQGAFRAKAAAAAAADLNSATLSLFRWGHPTTQGLSVHVEFQSQGRRWMLYSNIAMPRGLENDYSDSLRKGTFRCWPGAQEELDRYLGRTRGHTVAAPAPMTKPASREPADPILDAPISFTWSLPQRIPERSLAPTEILARLAHEIRHPLVSNGSPGMFAHEDRSLAVYRVEKRPLREVLHELFSGYEIETARGAIFLRHPELTHGRLLRLPRAVMTFLQDRTEPYTLDDMVLLARSLTPWQITWLGGFLPSRAIDQLLATQELLRLYGELAPAQREALASGLPFTALTPTQQALFLAFAQRQRPFVEPWRFQVGRLRLTTVPPPARDEDGLGGPFRPVSRKRFEVRFQESDGASFPLDLFPPQGEEWHEHATYLVGKRFPLPEAEYSFNGMTPALADGRLRKRAIVLIFSTPFVEPYAGTAPPPATATAARALAERLSGTGVAVAHVTVGPPEGGPPVSADPRLPHLLHVADPGDMNGQPSTDLGSRAGLMPASPTAFVIDRDGIVRAVFEGWSAWDAARIGNAARAVAPAGAPTEASPRRSSESPNRTAR